MATESDRRSLDPFGVPLDVRMRNRKMRNIRPSWGLLTGNDEVFFYFFSFFCHFFLFFYNVVSCFFSSFFYFLSVLLFL